MRARQLVANAAPARRHSLREDRARAPLSDPILAAAGPRKFVAGDMSWTGSMNTR